MKELKEKEVKMNKEENLCKDGMEHEYIYIKDSADSYVSLYRCLYCGKEIVV